MATIGILLLTVVVVVIGLWMVDTFADRILDRLFALLARPFRALQNKWQRSAPAAPTTAGRFNAPPGWPIPAGWTPPQGWRPDPGWPPAPAGWQFWS